MRGLSLVAASGGYSLLLCTGFLLQWFLFPGSTGSRHTGPVVMARKLYSVGSVAMAQGLSYPIAWCITAAAAAAKSLQLCPTLWDPIDRSPPGFPIPGILHARTLEWAAISFSNA